MSPVPSMPTHNVTAGQDRLWMLLAVVNDRQAVRQVTVHGAEPPGSVVVASPPPTSAAMHRVADGHDTAPNRSPPGPAPSPPCALSLGPVGSPADYPLGAGAATVRGAAIDRLDGPKQNRPEARVSSGVRLARALAATSAVQTPARKGGSLGARPGPAPLCRDPAATGRRPRRHAGRFLSHYGRQRRRDRIATNPILRERLRPASAVPAESGKHDGAAAAGAVLLVAKLGSSADLDEGAPRRTPDATSSRRQRRGGLCGHEAAVITELDDHWVTVRLWRPLGRFRDCEVRCPPLALRKLDRASAP